MWWLRRGEGEMSLEQKMSVAPLKSGAEPVTPHCAFTEPTSAGQSRPQVPTNTWLPATDTRLFDPSLKGRRFKVRKEYRAGGQPFKNTVATNKPEVVIAGGGTFVDWMLLP